VQGGHSLEIFSSIAVAGRTANHVEVIMTSKTNTITAEGIACQSDPSLQLETTNADQGIWRKINRPLLIATMSLTSLAVASAQDTAAQTNFVSFRDFVQSVRGADANEITARPTAKVANAGAVEPMRQHLLNLYDGVNVTHSFVLGSQTVDCVPTNQQPSVRALGITNIASAPEAIRPPADAGNAKAAPTASQIPENQTADQFGNSLTCEAGTIPMRRITLDQMAHFASLQEFFQKGPDGAGHPPIPGKYAAPATAAHKYAYSYQYVNNWGDNDSINLWRPYVFGDIGEIFSLAQSWTIGVSSTVQTAEVGWQNYPARVGTENSVPFIYYTADNYQTTGCYDLTCSAFVQVSNALTFGAPFAASSYSVPDGGQYELQFYWEFYAGNWWLNYNGTWIGYYPGSVYHGGQLTKYSNLLEFGSESVGTTVWPAEGSGLWANNGWTYAAYQRELWYIAPNTTYSTYWDTLTPETPSPACYTITSPAYASNWGIYFYFGGPGGASCQ
jgi:hypothetical protein